MKGLPIKRGLQVLKGKTLDRPAKPLRQIIGFSEWCKLVWEPSKRMREERAILLKQNPSGEN